MRVADTRELTAAPFVVAPRARARSALRATVLAVAAGLAIVGGLRLMDDAAAAAGRHQQLQRQNAELRAEVGRLRTELELAAATRAALDRQVADLGERATDLERQLAFFRTRADRSQRSPRPAAEEHPR